MSRIHLILLLLFSMLIVAGCNMAAQSSVAQPPEQISTPAPDITCDQMVTLAETTVGLVCNGLARNQACYGNTLVNVEFQPNVNTQFVTSGDKVDLLSIKKLTTGPLNIKTHEWGIAVLKAQANLPDTLPGQNVTFLLYGDTTIDNPSPDMKAVTVSTRIGGTKCAAAPESAVLIQSPEGSQVAMNINGADVTLGSTAFVTTDTTNQRMMFAVLEGTGVISAFNTTQIVRPGQQTGIQLGGGTDGLQASGPPSIPVAFDIGAIQNAPVQLLDRKITIPPPLVGSPATDTPTPTPAQVQGAPTTVTTACVPNSAWTFRYVVQRGDNLSVIALKLNMRTADLQAGNCIDNPNNLIAGRTILVPRPVPANTAVPATAVPKATDTPIPQGLIGPNLRADANPINYGDCTNVRWDVDNIQSVYFEGQPVIGHDARQVCPTATTTYTLLVMLTDGSRQTFQITINVNSTCGNGVCESDKGENNDTCPKDCYNVS